MAKTAIGTCGGISLFVILAVFCVFGTCFVGCLGMAASIENQDFSPEPLTPEEQAAQDAADQEAWLSRRSTENPWLKNDGTPYTSAWDGLMEVAHDRLDSQLHDPGSKSVTDVSPIWKLTDTDGTTLYRQKCTVRAKNALGATVATHFQFDFNPTNNTLAQEEF